MKNVLGYAIYRRLADNRVLWYSLGVGSDEGIYSFEEHPGRLVLYDTREDAAEEANKSWNNGKVARIGADIYP